MTCRSIQNFCGRHPYAFRAIELLAAAGAIEACEAFSLDEAASLVAFLVGLIALASLHLVLSGLFRGRAVPRAVTIAAAVLWLAFLAYGFATHALSFAALCLHLAPAVSQWAALVWAPCVALCGAAAWLRAKGRRAAAVILRTLAALAAATGLAVVFLVWTPFAPWHACMETGNPLGPDPDRDIVQSLAWRGWDRCFDMRLYTRRADGDWGAWILRWGFPPRERLVVEFDGDRPKVLAIGAGRYVEPEQPAPDAPEAEGLAVYPGDLAPADLHALHQSLVHP
ncbi:MAG: hypothetical protein IJS32_00585 [Kiritimatiellae bacterium]|nr:hypothetical protein [Kiritimatiellia bacterium]